MFQRIVLAVAFGFALLSACLVGFAQQQQPAQQAPAPTVTLGRSYWFEICLVVVLVGGALWAVCRSSNRQ